MRQGLHSIPWNGPMASIRTPSSSMKDASGNARQSNERGCFAGSHALAWEPIGVHIPARPCPRFSDRGATARKQEGKMAKIHIETSIVSYLTARPSGRHERKERTQ